MSWAPWPPVMQPRAVTHSPIKVTMPGEGMVSKVGEEIKEVNPIKNFNRVLGKDAVANGGGKAWEESQQNSPNNISKQVSGLPDNLYA